MLRPWKSPSRALADLSNACAQWRRAPGRSTWPMSGACVFQQRIQRHSGWVSARSFATAAQDESRMESHNEHLEPVSPTISSRASRKLPLSCPGCGAPSQTSDQNIAGFYRLDSRRVLNHFGLQSKQQRVNESRKREDEIYRRVMEAGASEHIQAPQIPSSNNISVTSTGSPVCDRCHALKHQSKGEPIIHPSMSSIQAIVEESPHQRNHIYHVLDAADFPMSLIPNLASTLHLPKLRTQNRRSKHIRYQQGRTADVSFIITRSDLLAPKKEQVDRLMPYLQEVLRDALGRSGYNVRLGNVRCVSAKRGWWTRNVKEEIWDRGGAGWMVGKVNVGKSALYEVVFPKGRNQIQNTNVKQLREQAASEERTVDDEESNLKVSGHDSNEIPEADRVDTENELVLDENTLLPPARPETAYPDMPIVSSLPGTTASPIRIPFGNGKGELIDLPGIHRSSLDKYIQPQHHSAMIMKHRITPISHTLKPGQSLLLGGVIRITPKLAADEELHFMAYPFVSEAFAPHVTGTHKAIAIQTGVHSEASRDREGHAYAGSVSNIATDEAKTQIASAGPFRLQWDVTRRHTGPLTDRTAGKQKVDRLPFAVYGIDILLEGVGWVELTCQVRKWRHASTAWSTNENDPFSTAPDRPDVPEVEVFSPQGKFISSRRPMNAWVLNGARKTSVHERRPRPRQSIGMTKRQASSQAMKRMAHSPGQQ